MIVNRITLAQEAPIKNMALHKVSGPGGTSWGLGEAGYDIRIKQDVTFFGQDFPNDARFVLASSIEEFDMPDNLTGIVHDKSTWARKGLSVFNTVIEPGWAGFLTLELVYHGREPLMIPAGSGIAQVVFHRTTDEARYSGKYQNQENKPVEARESLDPSNKIQPLYGNE